MPIHDSGGSCSSSSDPFSRVRDQIQSQAICPVFRDQLRKWNWIFWPASSVAEPGGEASDDRPAEQAPVANPAMPAAGAQSLVALLSAGTRQYGGSGADGANRPPVPGDAVLRLAQDWLRREGHVVNRKRG